MRNDLLLCYLFFVSYIFNISQRSRFHTNASSNVLKYDTSPPEPYFTVVAAVFCGPNSAEVHIVHFHKTRCKQCMNALRSVRSNDFFELVSMFFESCQSYQIKLFESC